MNLKKAIERKELEILHPDISCEILLGGKDRLIDFSVFFEKNQIELEIIKEIYLREFNQTQVYNEKENLFFRQGLDTLLKFLKLCYNEMEDNKGQVKIQDKT